MKARREKVFGPGRAVPLDGNAKGSHCQLRQGLERPQQAATPTQGADHPLEVLEALLCGFHNSRSGACFPSYEAIAAKAECHRSTVAEALKALEWAGRAHLEAGQRLAGDCGGTVRTPTQL